MSIKIKHNKNLLLIIIILLILFILIVTFYLNKETLTEKFNELYLKNLDGSGKVEVGSCITDKDCVPFECCHPYTCVSVSEKQDCRGIFCTQECVPGTLDCGQGYCSCVSGKCKAVFDE